MAHQEVLVPCATVIAADEMVLPLASVIQSVTLVPSATSTGFQDTLPDLSETSPKFSRIEDWSFDGRATMVQGVLGQV